MYACTCTHTHTHLHKHIHTNTHSYECCRSTPFLEAVYRANSHVLLADEHCFRLQGVEGGKLTMQLMEPDRSEVPPGMGLWVYVCGCMFVGGCGWGCVLKCEEVF